MPTQSNWNKQPHICRQRCRNIKGATKGVGYLGYGNGKRKRCVSCEMYFPAKKAEFDKELCPCCGRQLRNKPKRKPSDQRAYIVGI